MCTPTHATTDDPEAGVSIVHPGVASPPTAALRLTLPPRAAPQEHQLYVQLHMSNFTVQVWRVSVQYVPQVELQHGGGGGAMGTVTLHVGRPGAVCRCYVSDDDLQVLLFGCVGVQHMCGRIHTPHHR